MRLFKATYSTLWSDSVVTEEFYQYILAPDFQTAGRLAETSGKIYSESGGLGNLIVGDLSGTLLRVEEIAYDVHDFQNTVKLTEIGSHMFCVKDQRLFKVELLAIKVIQE